MSKSEQGVCIDFNNNNTLKLPMGIRKSLWAHLTANNKAEKTDKFDIAVVKDEVSETYNYILIALQKITTDEYNEYENEKLFDIIDFYNKFAIDVTDTDVADLRTKIEFKILEIFDSDLLKDIIGDEELDISTKTKFVNIIDCIKNIDTKNKIIWPMKDRKQSTISIVEILTNILKTYSREHELYKPYNKLLEQVGNMFADVAIPTVGESFLEYSNKFIDTPTESSSIHPPLSNESLPSTARSNESSPSTARSNESSPSTTGSSVDSSRSHSPSVDSSRSPSPSVDSSPFDLKEEEDSKASLKVKSKTQGNTLKAPFSFGKNRTGIIGGKKSRRKPKKKKRTIRRRTRQ
jgi:hypothetical protein